MLFLARARQILRSTQTDGDNTDFELLLFRREIQVAAQIVPWGTVAQAILIVLLAIETIPSVDGFRIAWTACGLALSAYSFFAWRNNAKDPLQFEPRRVRRHMLVVIALFGVLWAVACVVTFSSVPTAQTLLLSGAIAGLMGGGAIALSTNRVLAVCWVVMVSAGAIVVQALQPESTLRLQAMHATLYAVMLCIGAFYLQHSFRARCRAEYLAGVERQKVELFLHEFEGGSRDWIWETHADGTVSHASERFAQVSGLSSGQLQSMTLGEVIAHLSIADRNARDAYTTLFNALDSEHDFYSLVVPLAVSGRRRWWVLSGRVNRETGGWRGVGADITDMKLAQDRIDLMARTDALTGLPNRHALNRELAERIRMRTSRCATHFAILDLDNFKAVNDTLGHPLGDKLLIAIGRRIQAMLDDGEFCARLGGDEFAIIAHSRLSDTAAIDRFKEFQSEVFRIPFRVDGSVLEITSSLGLTSSRTMDEVGTEALIVAADLALYGAKDLGRNRVNVYSTELRRQATARANSVRAITSALANHEFEMVFQPQVSAYTCNVVGFEALVRWRHPDGMLLPPADFIELAEETGLIVQLGREVISMVCRAAVTWPVELSVSVNISPRQLLSNGFAEALADGLRDSPLSPRRLVLEISESALVDPDARENLAVARASGMRVALDDFGAGYSSLAQMAHMPVDEIKIDRSFVEQLRGRGENPTATAVVGSVIELARALGVRTVAEGVETPRQLRRLTALGCDAYQGYLESPPMSPADILPYLAEREQRLEAERSIQLDTVTPPLRLISLPENPSED